MKPGADSEVGLSHSLTQTRGTRWHQVTGEVVQLLRASRRKSFQLTLAHAGFLADVPAPSWWASTAHPRLPRGPAEADQVGAGCLPLTSLRFQKAGGAIRELCPPEVLSLSCSGSFSSSPWQLSPQGLSHSRDCSVRAQSPAPLQFLWRMARRR